MSHVAPHRWADLARGRVSDGEQRRMLDHADACAACARARDRVGGAVAVFADIAETPAPELGWDHIRARVYWATSSERRERERTQKIPVFRRIPWSRVGLYAVPALAAAAATALLLSHAAGPAAPQISAPSHPTHVVTPPAPIVASALTGVVTLAQGHVAVDDASTAARVLAHPIVAGSTVATTDGRIAVQFGDGSVFSVGARSTVHVRRFDAGGIELALDGAGERAVEVAPRAPGQRFTVTAGDRTVEVRGTAFRVARRGGTVDVSCAHGLVAVRDTSGDLLVPAGQGVVVDDSESLADRAARPLDAAALSALMTSIGPRLPVWTETDHLYRTTAPLAIAAPDGRAVRVDGVVVGDGALVLRVMSGRHLVEAESRGGRFGAGEWIEAGPGRADGRIDARVEVHADVAAASPHAGTALASGTAEARAARKADLAAHLDQPRVANCLRALAKQGIGGTHVELELGVDAAGAITFLNVVDTDLPDTMSSCVRNAVAAVRFPAGPEATFRHRLDF